VVNADDFGFWPGGSEGILRAHGEGIVTSTTVTANMPAAADAVRRLDEAPGLGVGVHLNVCQGPVLSPRAAALAGDDGLMRRTGSRLVLACLGRRKLLEAVEAEFDAQIRWVLDCGIQPTHLDSHRHVHGYPPIFARVVKLARRYHIHYVRRHRESLPGGGWPVAEGRQRRIRFVLNVLGRRQAGMAADLLATAGTWGIAHTGRIDSAWLMLAARRLPAGVTEIMTHPGAGDDLPDDQTRLRQSRRTELEALCDPAVREAFARQGIELTHYGKL